MPKRTELPYLDELLDLFEIAKANGYEPGLDQFKYDLLNQPAVIPFPDSAGPDFAKGGLVRHIKLSPQLLNTGLGLLFKEVS
tara:strand:- start:155 stop:400 length:246 start_codon:yes stop_codon:yes gene_type:complete